jgi:hypothetical protein
MVDSQYSFFAATVLTTWNMLPIFCSGETFNPEENPMNVTLVFNVDDGQASALLAALGHALPTPMPPPPAGSFVRQDGLAVLDDTAALVVCDSKNASAPYLEALRLIATTPNLAASVLLKVVPASTLAGHQAASTKRVRRALGGHAGALYRVDGSGKVIVAPETREALARALKVNVPAATQGASSVPQTAAIPAATKGVSPAGPAGARS